MRSKESREMYLEVIYKLEQSNSIIHSVDIAKELGCSKSSVSRAMGVLKKIGYITHSPYGDIVFTKAGRKKAKQVFDSHQLLTAFFIKVLELDPETAENDACKIEHVISKKSLDAIAVYLKR